MREKFWILSISLAACTEGGAGPQRTVDAATVAAEARAYRGGGFTRMNRDARASRHGGDLVNIWVESAFAAEYGKVMRDETTADPDFPEGAMIVKEHVDAQGVMIALTVMYKGPTGSGGKSDDWYWERLEVDGTITVSGEVDLCIGCHAPRRAADWVFGVEADQRQ